MRNRWIYNGGLFALFALCTVNTCLAQATGRALSEQPQSPGLSSQLDEGHSRVLVTFQIHNCSPTHNQKVVVLGSIPELGNWKADSGLKLSFVGNVPNPTWAGTISLPAHSAVQYKYVLWDGSQIVWEASLKTQSGNHEVELPDGGRVTYSDGNFEAGK